MRKILFVVALLAGFNLQQAHAQACDPVPALVNLGLAGIYPNPLINSGLPDGTVGVAYSQVITIIAIGDTTIDLSPLVGFPVPPVTAEVAEQVLNNITDLPPGLTFACSPMDCTVEGDSAGCIIIQGTPTMGGTYNPNMDTDIGIIVPTTVPVIGGTTQYLPVPGLTYDLTVNDPSVGIDDFNPAVISVIQNSPNPFAVSTEVQYHAPKPGQIEFTVTDLTGMQMARTSYRAAAGSNTLRFERNGLASGIYFATLSNGENAATFKMIILD